MKIYFDGELPESCASCQFLVHCCECEGYENYCPFIGDVGYDLSDDLKDGAPVTPTWERHEECPLEQRPHGEWVSKPKRIQVDETDEERIFETRQEWFCSSCGKSFGFRKPEDAFCKYCGSDNRPKEGESE